MVGGRGRIGGGTGIGRGCAAFAEHLPGIYGAFVELVDSTNTPQMLDKCPAKPAEAWRKYGAGNTLPQGKKTAKNKRRRSGEKGQNGKAVMKFQLKQNLHEKILMGVENFCFGKLSGGAKFLLY